MLTKRILILALLSLTLAACGKKGPVRPLLQALPGAPQDLVVQQQGARFLIAFSVPSQNQDGSPLTDLQAFQIYKMKYDPARDCPECRDTSVLLQSVDLDYLRDVRRDGDRLGLWDRDLEPGFGYQYRVVAVNRKGSVGLPAVVKRPYFPPPPAPTGLQATPHDQMAQLQWRPLPVAIPTGKLLGYNLYRRRAGGVFPALPVNHAPLKESPYEDFGLENGTSYEYALRGVVEVSGVQVESPLSEPVAVTPAAGR